MTGSMTSPATAITNPAALECRECGARYPVEPLTICEECFGPLEPAYDLDAIDGEDDASGAQARLVGCAALRRPWRA